MNGKSSRKTFDFSFYFSLFSYFTGDPAAGDGIPHHTAA
jgi:hypothetical protein